LNRQELEQRLENVVNSIQTSETELKRLREEKKQRILKLNPSDLNTINARIRELEGQVEDSKLAHEALEKEIQESQEKEPEAAKIRKRLAEELWPAALVEYEKLKRIHGELGPVSADLTCDKFMAIPAKPVSLVYGAASRDSVQRKNVTADGKINPNKSLMGTPKLNADGSITWEVNDEPKPRPANVRADGKIDATKSIMGNPKLNPDGSITWT
jgi:hypothetical protein